MKQYVQHISGKGEKWELSQDLPYTNEYQVHTKNRVGVMFHYLPRSEYRLCEPPEEWEDVTEQCTVDSAISLGSDRALSILHALDRTYRVDVLHKSHVNHYRVRKIDHLHNGPAFIIERKKS